MEFEPMCNKRSPVFSCPGERMVEKFVGHKDSDGQIVLQSAGMRDLYSEIQSHADSVDINVLLSRYANGETDVLTQRQGLYIDMSGMPSTLADYLNIVNQGKVYFDSLPLKQREAFGFDFNRFAESIGTSEFDAVFNPEPVKAVMESEVVAE